MEPLPPKSAVGRYRIDRLLSQEGGFSLVYIGHPVDRPDTRVAIKECVLPGKTQRRGNHVEPRPERRHDFDWTKARFRQEGRFLGNLNPPHPNIVRIFDLIETNGTIYLVMELLAESLEDIVKRDGPQSLGTAMQWFGPVSQALQYCESQGCHHLDIAPKNIMFRGDGTPVLIDFGFSKLGNQSRLRSTRFVTTDGYSAPEKYNTSSRDLDARADVYSLAATMNFALSGEEPIDARLRKPGSPGLAPSAEARRDQAAGAAMQRVLDKAFHIVRAERFASVRNFAEDVRKSASAHDGPVKRRNLDSAPEQKARGAGQRRQAGTPGNYLPPALRNPGISDDQRRKVTAILLIFSIIMLLAVFLWAMES